MVAALLRRIAAAVTHAHCRQIDNVSSFAESEGQVDVFEIEKEIRIETLHLLQGARDAVSAMVDLVSKETGMTALDAYMLCSVCGDLRISEIVDMPNWTVSFYFPKIALG